MFCLVDSAPAGDTAGAEPIFGETAIVASEVDSSKSGRSCRIYIRVTSDERAAIEGRASRVGLSVSEYLRRRALRDEDRPVIVVDVEVLQKMYRDLRHAGGNLNQLCRWMHRNISDSAEIERFAREAIVNLSRASTAVADFIEEARDSI